VTRTTIKSSTIFMLNETDPQHLNLADLAKRCGQETDLYFTRQDSDSRYCFELFRRAILDKDMDAWRMIITQYQSLVARWVDKWFSKHPDFSSTHDEAQDFIAQAFERFWVSFTPAKLEKSQSLAAILRYLQMCVNGAITDTWRKLRYLQIERENTEDEQEYSKPDPTPEDVLQVSEFWQLIKKKSKDSKEYIVVYASFSLGLSPREILVEYPGIFKDIHEIYQCKANLLDRLERDEEIKGFVG